ncbi:MAG TPA: regulatory protein RecX [Streptosporangiaceae bacterium]|nr:regulatory protein RecX [Streptosporangiaceae bacterium]
MPSKRRGAAGHRIGPAGEAGPDADPETIARLICLRLLTAAPRTRAQLADALKQRRVPADAAESVLGRFTEVGLIDDATFASAWVESRHYGRGLGRRALATELGRRGVAREDIAAAVGQLTPEAERAMALSLVQRRLPSTAGQPRQVQVRKLAGMLARKGYSAGLAYSVVREALDRAGVSGTVGDEEFAEEYDAVAEDGVSGEGID